MRISDTIKGWIRVLILFALLAVPLGFIEYYKYNPEKREELPKFEFVSEVIYIGESSIHIAWDGNGVKRIKEEQYGLHLSYGELEENFVGTKKEVDSIIPILKKTLIRRSEDLEYLRNKAEKQ